jgi:GH43 family beta-xylosidase
MAGTFKNPVWPGYFADPFVLRWRGEYFAFGTAAAVERDADGSAAAFKILRSRDLSTWVEAGAALRLAPQETTNAYWAPEVAELNDRFHLFYSTAPSNADERHRIHVATSESPTGPFVASGAVLPEAEGFCIDAHPFRDPRDGSWYLFFAKDYFDGRAGTGLAVVRLSSDLRRSAGESRVVVRANADWHIYERRRPLYGQMWDAWHTVEGPCVVFHDGRYYCFYSGGNWQTHDYGVSYAVADHPLGPWSHASKNEPVVLRQVPGEVLGPGHNSYVIAPDDRTELLVYHAWDPARTARRMCLDRLVWTKDGPRCLGPTTAPQSWAARRHGDPR